MGSRQCSLYFFKSACTQNFLCVKYQHSSIIRTICIKCVLKTFFIGKFIMCATSYLVCAHLTTCVCARTPHILEGTLETELKQSNIVLYSVTKKTISFRKTHF